MVGVKPRVLLASACLLFPLLGAACESTDRRWCERQFAQLVRLRTAAIEDAFGDLFAVLPSQIKITYVSYNDPRLALIESAAAYDPEHKTLMFARTIIRAKTPNPLADTRDYWPYYQDQQMRRKFPVVETVDNVLWGAFLQETARKNGMSWPHKDCSSVDVGKRLPCEMLVSGIAEYIKQRRGPIFNTNRMEMIWPKDFLTFTQHIWRTDKEYQDVQRYGGILLIRPLINEFGVSRTLAYVARTPFHVEGDDMRAAALRYQEQARKALVW